jgi:hypothetical protein
VNAEPALPYSGMAQSQSSLARLRCFTARIAAQFGVVLFVFPETKGVTLEAMQKKLGIH